jgi:hypothetical protein
MGPHNLLEFYRNLKEANLSLTYQGMFDDSITVSLIDLSESNININEEMRRLRNTLSFIMAESFQNIVRHGEDTDKGQTGGYPSTFLVRNQGNKFYVTSVNIIENRKVGALKERLDKVNTGSTEQLKKMFSEAVSSNEFTDKGGAGLGLIDMSRKSREPIDYHFKEVTPEKSYFFMRVKLQQVNDTNVDFAPLSEDIEMHYRFIDENMLMLYKGDFSQETVVPVLQMLEENMHGMIIELALQKKIFNVLVEVLQNISKHGDVDSEQQKTGLFMIGKEGPSYKVVAGNLLGHEDATALKLKLSTLAKLEVGELNALYKESLRHPHTTKGGAGLGLIDIYRDSNSRVEFDFSKVNEQQSFYSIAITI